MATGRDGFAQVLRGEWTKLRSVRSTTFCVVIAAVLMILFAVLGASGSSTNANENVSPTQLHLSQFHFVHQPLAGDGTVIARVQAQRDAGEWARAGIMIKAGTERDTPYTAVMVTPKHGVLMQAEFKPDLAGSASTAPRWLKLTRAGATITGYESADGNSYTTVGTVTVAALPATAQVGLFVTAPPGMRTVRVAGGTSSGPDFKPSTAVFDTVSVVPTAPGIAPAPWADGDVGGPGHNMDRSEDVGGGSTRAGGTFTVTGVGDLRGRAPTELGDDDVTKNVLTGVIIALIAIAALGVLFITSEYTKGVARTTFTASPRRGRVLVAKAIVLGAVAFAVGVLASVAALVIARPIMRDNGFGPPAYPAQSLLDVPVLRAVVGTGLFLAAIAVFSLAVGSILRRTAGAITLVIVLVVVPSIASGFLPLEVERWINRLTPLAGLAIQQTRDRWDVAIGPWAGFAVLCGYVAAALGLALWLLPRRDV